MRTTMTVQGMTLAVAMLIAEYVSRVTNLHMTGFTYRSADVIEIHFEENEPETEPDPEPEYTWDNPDIVGDEEVYVVWEGECEMCGLERLINDTGYCAHCWAALNSE